MDVRQDDTGIEGYREYPPHWWHEVNWGKIQGLTPEEQAYYMSLYSIQRDARGDIPICDEASPMENWVCTRVPNHEGEHVAHMPGQVLDIWGEIQPRGTNVGLVRVKV